MAAIDVTITPHELTGSVVSVASKSIAHRIILLAALTEGTTHIACATSSQDIEATLSCVQALGARVEKSEGGFSITGIGASLSSEAAIAEAVAQTPATLDCGESGSTLRFLLPIACALGRPCELVGHGRLAERPLSPLYEQLIAHGASLSEQGAFPLKVMGPIHGGAFALPGDVSSQYISGLLMAAPLIDGNVSVLVSQPVQSEPYVTLTIRALEAFGVSVEQANVSVDGITYLHYSVENTRLVSPGSLRVEGDWSNAAFWLSAGALSKAGIEVTGVDCASPQGDRSILAALALFGARISRSRESAAALRDPLRAIELDVSDIPDLVPPLAAVAAVAEGTTRLKNAGRLRLKESDRLATVSAAVNALGGKAQVLGDDLVIEGGTLSGGTVDAANDHRIAMLAAVMACSATEPVTVRGAQCVAKSYPAFWEDYVSLGGQIEITEASAPEDGAASNEE